MLDNNNISAYEVAKRLYPNFGGKEKEVSFYRKCKRIVAKIKKEAVTEVKPAYKAPEMKVNEEKREVMNVTNDIVVLPDENNNVQNNLLRITAEKDNYSDIIEALKL